MAFMSSCRPLNVVHSYYDREPRPQLASMLTAKDMAKLVDGFLAEASPDQTLPMMLTLLAGYPSEALDRAAVGAIDGVMRGKSLPWWAKDAVEQLFLRRNRAPSWVQQPPPEREELLRDPLLG